MRVRRTDAGTVRGVEITPQGGLRIPAVLTRTGVLQYQDGAGKKWGEYRPESEVFAADSLASLRGAPVTNGHPDHLVTTQTFRADAVGHTCEDVRRDGEFVAATLIVNDAPVVASVNAKDLHDISCGYECDVDQTPGVTATGERYDAIQRSIRYNHVAVLPPGAGRAGPDVALRMDGSAVEVRQPQTAPAATNSSDVRATATQSPTSTQVTRADGAQEHLMKPLKIRGREFKLDADTGVDAAQGAVDDVVKKSDDDAAELTQIKAKLQDALMLVAAAENKATVASAAAAQPVTEESIPEDVMDSALVNREALRTAAKKHGVEIKGLKRADARKAIVVKAHPAVKLDGLDAKMVSGLVDRLFDAIVVDAAATAARTDSNGAARTALEGDPTKRNDSNDDPAAKMAKNREAQREAAMKAGR
jgi:hypothetical protein